MYRAQLSVVTADMQLLSFTYDKLFFDAPPIGRCLVAADADDDVDLTNSDELSTTMN